MDITGQHGFRRLSTLLSALVFLAGAGIFLYPPVSNYLAEKAQVSVIEIYENGLGEIEEAALQEEWKKAREYNENLAGDPVHDPFVAGSGYALPENYQEVLNMNGDGVMGYIEIPKISVKLPIYHGTDTETLEKGVGHIESTSLPIGGGGTQCVLTGHRGLPRAELFSRLDELEEGDHFYLSILDETLAYEVDQIETVLPDELESLIAHMGEDLVTLVTCTPYGVNTHRLLVRGKRIEYVEEEKEAKETIVGRVTSMRYQYIGIGVGLLILFFLLLVVRLVQRYRKRERGHEKT